MLRAIKRIQTVQIQYLFKNGRRYHNRVGKHPVEDPRSIYDSKVQYLWLPSDWKQSQVESRNILKRTVWATLGISEGWFTTSPEAKELNELYIKYFYVPYWIMAAGVYSAIDHNTMHQEYPEGRLALDYTYSLSGTSHGALKILQFPIPTTKPLDSNVLALPSLENCVYIPFSVPPPLHHREALMTLGSSMESQFTRNVRIRKGVKAKVAAHPVLEPLALVEYEFQGEYITAVHCPRLSTDNTRVFRHGKWTHDAEEIGPLGKSFEVAWQGSNSHSIAEKTYKEIQTSLEQRIRSWLKKPPSSGNFTPLNDALWASSLVGQEAAYAIRPWRASKLELWKKGYELAG